MSGAIQIVDYDPTWAAEFCRIRDALVDALGPLALFVEHVGSTAVPGLPARPILDIDVVIEHRDRLPAVIDRLAALGYVHRGDEGVQGREVFEASDARVPLDGSEGTWPVHELYVCARDSRELRRHLDFRDWLRCSEQDARAYATLKRETAASGGGSGAYRKAKAAFVERILARAGG